MYILQNDFITIKVDSKGAELKSLFDKRTKFEWIWQSDSRFWAKSSPVLFPIVGSLKDNKFYYNGRLFELPRHGFARDLEFELVHSCDEKLIFELNSTPETNVNYPFEFSLRIIYELIEKSLYVCYLVRNIGKDDLYFSLGAHPAFNFPKDILSIDEMYLYFPLDSKLKRYYLNNNLLSTTADSIELRSNELFLNQQTFIKDAWILKDLCSKEVYLKNKVNDLGIKLSFEKFPYLGLWSVPGSSFICLEPWAGLPDTEEVDHLLENKEGMILLNKGEMWTGKWSVFLS